ncbi:MAG: isoprenyl transferase [Acidobacteriia bacterium]|nr:isoprenyl transferase [Terriglobia bacterium]
MTGKGVLAQPGTVEASLLRSIDRDRLPRHVAVIMDGNGRWARQRRLPRVAGHRAGIDSVREIVEVSARLGLEVLTLYAFSVENWKRPQTEVRILMRLLKEYVKRELTRLVDGNIRFLAIGRVEELAPSVRHELERAMEKTSSNTGMILNVALNYGGRAELVDTFNRLLDQQNGRRIQITEELISQSLYTGGIPDPDLLIRTSGELRVSNFLLWQIAYAEIYVTPTYWPDFRRRHLFEAILDFQKRDRRYGGIPDVSR